MTREAWVDSLTEAGEELDRPGADADNLVLDGVADDTDTSNKGLGLVVLALVQDLILNLIDAFLAQSPGPREYHSHNRLPEDID